LRKTAQSITLTRITLKAGWLWPQSHSITAAARRPANAGPLWLHPVTPR